MNIHQATTPEELEAIYRFRYQIYVEEMNRKQEYADHEHKRIVDPLDKGAVVLGAWENDEIVGTVRMNLFVDEAILGEYYAMYAFDRLSWEEKQTASITTRLMIHPKYRGGTLAMRLAKEIYLHNVKNGITCDLIDCNSHLVKFFLGLGYQIHRDDLVHPEYGAVTVMKLNLLDCEYLKSIRSPVASMAEQWLAANPQIKAQKIS